MLKKCALLFSFFIAGLSTANAINLLGKLEEVSKSAISTQQKNAGQNKLLTMLIQCEFEETCILRMISELHTLSQNDPNPMYKLYKDFLISEKKTLRENATRCKSTAKQQVRKVFGDCLRARVVPENAKPHTRGEIDKANDLEDICLKNKMELLAKEENLYAQAIMVNFAEQMRDQKSLNYWYDKMQKQNGTAAFKLYLECNDIP